MSADDEVALQPVIILFSIIWYLLYLRRLCWTNVDSIQWQIILFNCRELNVRAFVPIASVCTNEIVSQVAGVVDTLS